MLNITSLQGDAHQNHNKKSPHPILTGWLKSRTLRLINAAKEVDKEEHL